MMYSIYTGDCFTHKLYLFVEYVSLNLKHEIKKLLYSHFSLIKQTAIIYSSVNEMLSL